MNPHGQVTLRKTRYLISHTSTYRLALRALEAETSEKILKMSDDAIYERRNVSIEQECRVKENEYNT